MIGDRSPFRFRGAGVGAGMLVAALLVPSMSAAGPWSGGVHAGVTTRTIDGGLFTLGGNLEYHTSDFFSLGPTVWIAPGDGLSEWGVSGQARVRWNLENEGYPPFTLIGLAGLGLIGVQADAVEPLPEDDDLGFYLPIGGGLEYALLHRVALAGTVELRFHNLEVRDREDQVSFGFLFGLRWLP